MPKTNVSFGQNFKGFPVFLAITNNVVNILALLSLDEGT